MKKIFIFASIALLSATFLVAGGKNKCSKNCKKECCKTEAKEAKETETKQVK